MIRLLPDKFLQLEIFWGVKFSLGWLLLVILTIKRKGQNRCNQKYKQKCEKSAHIIRQFKYLLVPICGSTYFELHFWDLLNHPELKILFHSDYTQMAIFLGFVGLERTKTRDKKRTKNYPINTLSESLAQPN
jgi:hypothetical protein